MEKITLYSNKVYLSEEESDPDSYTAKFIICDFTRNKNGVALNRKTIENWMSTLKNKPLVGKIKMRYDGEYDFTGHNVKRVKKIDENGNEYNEIEFDTEAFGTFVDVSIEKIDDIEYIVAICKIWKRFTKACDIIVKRIQEGTLYTSWEIAVEKSVEGVVDGITTKIIDAGRFIGHCLLGRDVSPAYDSSGLLSIASVEYDNEFAEALSQDIENLKEEDVLNKDGITQPDKTQDGVTTSQLTINDLRQKIREAAEKKLNNYCYIAFLFPVESEVWVEAYSRESELDYVRFTYTVENDVVTLSEPENVKLTVSVDEINTKVAELEQNIADKNDAIIKSGEEIEQLKSTIAELTPYKEKFEQAEQERIATEQQAKKDALVKMATKHGLITQEEIESSEEIKGYIENLDEKSIKAILADRYMSREDGTIISSTSEHDETNTSVNLSTLEDEPQDYRSIIKGYLSK